MKSAVFFERDGILNEVRVVRGQPVTPLTLEEFRIKRELCDPLKQLKSAGFLLIATTNQPGLSRGHQSRRELDLMHKILMAKLPLDDLLLCPHDETDSCPCRKPNAGLLFEAAFKWHIDLDHSYVISDKWHDAQAAHIAGCTSLLLQSPWVGTGHHDFVLPTFSSIVEKIIHLHQQSQSMTAGTSFA